MTLRHTIKLAHSCFFHCVCCFLSVTIPTEFTGRKMKFLKSKNDAQGRTTASNQRQGENVPVWATETAFRALHNCWFSHHSLSAYTCLGCAVPCSKWLFHRENLFQILSSVEHFSLDFKNAFLFPGLSISLLFCYWVIVMYGLA